MFTSTERCCTVSHTNQSVFSVDVVTPNIVLLLLPVLILNFSWSHNDVPTVTDQLINEEIQDCTDPPYQPFVNF